MLERAASNGKDINRDDFYNIMTKKTFWKNYIYDNIIYLKLILEYIVINKLNIIISQFVHLLNIF